ncbi:hypothetical protein KP79_PYT00901 [Mizuhopecten yessoensis]|uniref:Uncharacterized protein n=1 Tax=Mizuhopecten yessoensis TaxID=6573 RepID=A0A210QNI8_MIZYE|nr:hypothetical protein KP79_PYT00901 [Mizuhopecten yessoensis]
MGQMTRPAFGEIADEMPNRGRHVLARSETAENIDTETMNAVVTDDSLLMVRGRIKGVTEEMEKVIEIDRQP